MFSVVLDVFVTDADRPEPNLYSFQLQLNIIESDYVEHVPECDRHFAHIQYILTGLSGFTQCRMPKSVLDADLIDFLDLGEKRTENRRKHIVFECLNGRWIVRIGLMGASCQTETRKLNWQPTPNRKSEKSAQCGRVDGHNKLTASFSRTRILFSEWTRR